MIIFQGGKHAIPEKTISDVHSILTKISKICKIIKFPPYKSTIVRDILATLKGEGGGGGGGGGGCPKNGINQRKLGSVSDVLSRIVGQISTR